MVGNGVVMQLAIFFPRYKLDRLPPTPVSTLIRFRELTLQEGIRYVYLGNVPNHEGNNTPIATTVKNC